MSIPVRNGGLLQPLSGEPLRLVRARHDACGVETRVDLPRGVPARAVRRLVCEGCEEPYDVATVAELGLIAPKSAPAPETPATDSRFWRWGSFVVAAFAVVGILLLIQGGPGEQERSPTSEPSTHLADEPSKATEAPTGARFVSRSGFSLALPPGWKEVRSDDGVAFAARSADGKAQATLWIERAPLLGFQEFVARTSQRLRSLPASETEVVERINAPTIDGTVVRLRADARAASVDSAAYEVTLRATGPYRYYLATTLLPGASRESSEAAELIHRSFVPEAAGGAEVETTIAPGSHQAKESQLP
jgi:hypothetical protein